MVLYGRDMEVEFMAKELSKIYEPKEVEKRIDQLRKLEKDGKKLSKTKKVVPQKWHRTFL